MNINRLLKVLFLTVICVLCGIVGGYMAIRFLPADVISSFAYSDDLSDAEIISVLNRNINRISTDVSPSIVSVISKGNLDSLTKNEESNETKEEKTDKDKDKKDSDQINLGTGSGIIIRKDGYIVTNNHVVQHADSVTVRLSNNKELPAKIIGRDTRSDIAVLKIEEDNLTEAKLGDSYLIRTGDIVFALGSPLGLELTGSLTMGIVSGTDRTLLVDGQKLTLIQTDAAINPGNSGGALVNIKGEVIGINTLKEFYAGSVAGIPLGVEGVGFAIPINTVKPIVEELIEQGFITRPGLGITVLVGATSNEKGAPEGILVDSVAEGGSADKAGIKAGDIIINFEGAEIKFFHELVDEINKYQIGDSVDVTVWRKGEELTFKVMLEQLKE